MKHALLAVLEDIPRVTKEVDSLLALGQMPPGYKQVLVLHNVLGYEHNEIALLVKRSMGNSKSQLHKARLRMRALL